MTGKVGVSKSLEPTSFDFSISIDNVILYDLDGDENTLGDQLLANGNISFNSDFVLDFEINNYHLDRLIFKTILSEEVSLRLTSQWASLPVWVGGDLKIAEFSFHPFVAGYIPTVPPFPIVIIPKLDIYVGLMPSSKSPTEVNVTQTANLIAGIKRESGYWQPISDFSSSFSFASPSFQEGSELNAYAGPRLNFLLYGVAGPYGGIYNRIKLETGETWSLYGRLEALLGAKMEIFSRTIADYADIVINYEYLIAQGEVPPEITDKIVFVSYRDGNTEIYIMNSDGSNQQNLTNNPARDGYPTWSQDYKKIAFVSTRDSNEDESEIYIMNSDGSNVQRLTYNGEWKRSPSWSFDGTEIVYSQSTPNTNINGLYVIEVANPSNVSQIISQAEVAAWDPDWSPVENKIVFTERAGSTASTWFDLYIINSNGSNLTNMTNDFSEYYDASWSPSGDRIAYCSLTWDDSSTPHRDIWIMDSDGSNQVNLTYNPSQIAALSNYPSWSPDGSKIIYSHWDSSDGDAELYIMNSDGTNKTKITNNSSDDVAPSWSP